MVKAQHIIPPKSGPVHILVADDHTYMRKALSNLLSNQEDFIVVAEAATGREAITLCAKLKPHLILMDVSMPDMNGIDATAQIHDNFPNTRVIGLSMYNDSATREAMLNAGAKAYVVKTELPDRLVDTIRNL